MKYIKNTFKYTLATIVALLLIVNVFILITGRKYLYKGIANTYLKGRSGPSINESELFDNRMVKWECHSLRHKQLIITKKN